jgi:mannose-6-phosphate isomerase-like protein (cupin superfamily)
MALAERNREHGNHDSGVETGMNDIVKSHNLEDIMRTMPQLNVETFHYFADGMYARVVPRPAGAVIVGKVHKREHFYICTKGMVHVYMDNSVKTLSAGDVVVSKPGTKRVVVAVVDSICMTVHRTKKHNLDKIEKQLIEPDPKALFDAANKLKVKELT